MGMLLNDSDGVAGVSGRQFWATQLENDRILLHEIDKAIFAFSSSSGAGGVLSYTIDTGQDKQTVTRADLTNLTNTRNSLIREIAQLENMLNNDGGRRIVPGF